MRCRALAAAIAGLACAAAAAPDAPDAGASAALAILDAKVAGEDASAGSAITQALAAHAANDLGLAVVSLEDVRRVLAFEQARQALGCDTEACDAGPRLREALGVGTLVAPSLSRMGERLLLSVAVFDAAQARPTGRATRELSRADEAPEAARDLLHRLLRGAERPRPVSRLAVLYFDNGGGPALDPLRKGLADMLITDLSRVEGVSVVERAKLEALLAELRLQRSKAFDPAAAQRLGRLLGAQHVVVGAFFELLGSLRLDARVVKVETGEISKAAGVSGRSDEFLALEQKLAAELAAGLPGRLSPAESVPPDAAPAFPDVLEYAKALELADAGKLKEARARAAKLAAARPRFAAAVALARRLGAAP